jgi:hypothetical protein
MSVLPLLMTGGIGLWWWRHVRDGRASGTGEVRAWISVAAAMKRPAKVVEYVPAHCTQTGCGFVYWPAEA